MKRPRAASASDATACNASEVNKPRGATASAPDARKKPKLHHEKTRHQYIVRSAAPSATFSYTDRDSQEEARNKAFEEVNRRLSKGGWEPLKSYTGGL